MSSSLLCRWIYNVFGHSIWYIYIYVYEQILCENVQRIIAYETNMDSLNSNHILAMIDLVIGWFIITAKDGLIGSCNLVN